MHWAVLCQDLAHICIKETEAQCQQSSGYKTAQEQRNVFSLPWELLLAIHVCLPSRGPVGCLQLFATLQVVQKLWLFIRNVTVAYACFSFLFIWRPEALCCKLKLFSGFAPGCSAPFDSSVIFPSWSPALTAALFQPSPSTPFYFHITDHHAAQSLVGKISPHNPSARDIELLE